MSPTQFILISAVRVYRWVLSPAKMFFFGPLGRCRFTPSCSQYALEALEQHGARRGVWLALRRICRCQPWGDCGHDPVPEGTFPTPHFFAQRSDEDGGPRAVPVRSTSEGRGSVEDPRRLRARESAANRDGSRSEEFARLARQFTDHNSPRVLTSGASAGDEMRPADGTPGNRRP